MSRQVPVPHPRSFIAALLLGALLVCASLAPAAGAAPHWTKPVTIATGSSEAFLPQAKVAVGPEGEAVAVWVDGIGKNALVYAATREPGLAWSAPVAVSSVGVEASEPEVGIDDTGEATAVWFSRAKPRRNPIQVEAATMSAGGAWSSPALISAGTELCGCALKLAVDGPGDAVATWTALAAAGNSTIAAASMQAGGSWSPAVLLGSPASDEYNSAPDVAIDDAGEAVVVWAAGYEEEEVEGSTVSKGMRIEEATMSPAGMWSAPTEVWRSAGYALEPQVALDPEGNATAIWSQLEGFGSPMLASTRPVAGPWPTPVQISPAGLRSGYGPRLGVDAEGVATALWFGYSDSEPPTVLAASGAGSSWSESVQVSAEEGVVESPEGEFEGGSLGQELAVSPDGGAVAVWNGSTNFNEEIKTLAAAMSPSGTWSTPVTLASMPIPIPTLPTVGIAADGDATAVWMLHRAVNKNFALQSADMFLGVPLTVGKVGEGSVTSEPAGIECAAGCTQETRGFEEGAEVTLTASAASGYVFTGWSNCDSGTKYGRQCVVVATAGHRPVKAHFKGAVPVAVEKIGTAGGSVSSTPIGISCARACNGAETSFLVGKRLILKAVPEAGAVFSGWSLSAGECTLSEEGRWCTFEPSGPVTAKARFDTPRIAFTVSKEGSGQGTITSKPAGISCGTSCKSASATFKSDAEIAITVTLGKGTTQVTWTSGAGTCTGHALTCTVPASAERLVAKFG